MKIVTSPNQFRLRKGLRLSMVANNAIDYFSESMMYSGVNAWSVSGETLASSDFASSLFAVSLFPYLGLLFFLSRPESKTPKLVIFE